MNTIKIFILPLLSMDIKHNYYDEVVKHYEKLLKNPIYRINGRLYYSTHLNGPHIDFYHEPYSLNKNTPLRNFKKFNSKILKSINNLNYCEKYGLYLNENVVNAMIEQLTLILNESENYWKFFNFDKNIISNINKVYLMYKLYLETYVSRIHNKSKNKHISYEMSLYTHLGTIVSSDDVLNLGKHEMKKCIDSLEKLHNKQFKLILEDYQNFGTKCESESEVLTLTMKHIFDLYNYFLSNDKFKSIEIPEPHTIKLKWIQPLKAKWSSKGKVSGRYFFLNGNNIGSYKKEQLLRLCIHEVIPGHITFRLNTNKIIKSYFANHKVKKQIRKNIKSGTKAVNEGFASFVEKLLLDFSTKEDKLNTMTMLLFNKLFHAVRLIIDVSLNTDKLEVENAKQILRNYTNLSEDGISAEVLKYYAHPGQACAYCFGNCYYNVLEEIYKKNNSDDFYSDMFQLQMPLPYILKYVDQKFLDEQSLKKID